MSKRRFKSTRNSKNEKKIDESTVQRSSQNKKNRTVYNQTKESPLKKLEYPEYTCTKCGKIIEDLNSAIADKDSGQPIHFDCIIEFLKNSEELKPNEEIVYIGNGNFALVYFENPKIRKKFKIIKLIEWEDKNKIYQWKTDIADMAAKI